jgi:hypothetical protein
MEEIAMEHAAKNKIKSFALSETSTAALDLHLLNAVINDDTQIRAGSRLQLAVQWNRTEVGHLWESLFTEGAILRGYLWSGLFVHLTAADTLLLFD